MIIKEAKESSGKAYFVIPEDADDLLTLRRIIQNGDYVFADTTRVIKKVKEFARPDKGERIKVRVSVRVESISLDDIVDRLRITGIITNTDNELVPRGIHHSLTVQVGDTITIDKNRKWNDVETNILKRSSNSTNFILVAIDAQEAAVAKISGTHLKIIPNIYSGQSGKRYQHAAKNNPNIEIFFDDIAKTIQSMFSAAAENNSTIIIFGPGETKRRFYNLLVEKHKLEKGKVSLIDGVDVAGEDGIFVFLRSPAIKEAMSSSKLATVSSILDEIMRLVHKGDAKYAMGMQEVSNAASIKAIEYLVFSDSIFKTTDENDVVKLLNLLESQGAKSFAVDSSTDIGWRVSSLGGIVALLRYSIR
ncbi:MAG TPA: mRNA surveillance protein pelota [Nitrososphaeraceae archaeon]|jgi:protein pelota|nr:mRNA surveillance protein pelota [Nitrososphaeraceae archaeon]